MVGAARGHLGSGLIDHSQNMMAAAMQIAEKYVWAQRSYRVWIAPPTFEAPEHVFDFVPLFVEGGVIGDCDLPIGFRGDADGDAAFSEGGAERISVVA
jgi:hypothetical protein